jgi:hypothetical protein
MTHLFDDATILSPYSRADALADGSLVAADPQLAREAGIKVPVALTRGAWARCVTVPASVPWQDETGRLWDVLWMASLAIRRAPAAARAVAFRVCVDNGAARPEVALVATIGPGDAGEPVLTVMLPGED